MARKNTSYRHVWRVFGLIIVVAAAALVLRAALVPDTFGDLGHYRAAAIGDARIAAVHHVGKTTCAECHDELADLHAKDAHAWVQCETCHGPGTQHVSADGDGAILRPNGKEACLVCHRLLLARPGEFAQISVEDHYRYVGVAEPATQCIDCHDPHEPLYMDRDLRTARLHPLIHRCRDCHAGRADESLPRPADHPAIFECDYCHEEIVADFAARSHSTIRCTACHIFFRESEFAGRILRDADPRFCMLCHGEADFRSANAAPSIVWPEHREDMAEHDADSTKRCVDCHRENIHGLPAPASAGPATKESNDGR
jgi:hypothetical protein